MSSLIQFLTRTTTFHPLVYVLIVLLAGVICRFNFAPYNAWYAGIIGLTGLFYVLSRCRWQEGFVYLYLFWVAYFLGSMYWAYIGIRLFAGVSLEKAILLTIFSATFYSLFLCIPWFISFKSPEKSLWRFFSLPLVWLVAEWSRYWILGGLTWSLIGYGHQSTWLAGWIPVFGVLGTSFFVALSIVLSIAIATVYIQIGLTSKSLLKSKTGFALLLSVFAIWFAGYGLKNIEWTKPVSDSAQISVSEGVSLSSAIKLASVPIPSAASVPIKIVQPNKLQQTGGYENSQALYEDWANHMETLNQSNWHEGLLIWPEGGIKGDSESLPLQLQQLQAQAKSGSTNLITGGLYFTDSEDGSPLNNNQRYNSVYGLGEASGLYHKVKMAPIGEYTPLSGFPGALFGRATDSPDAFDNVYQEPIEINYQSQTYLVSSSICYEIAFGNEVRKASREANILVNLSNDLWFDGSIQQDQSVQIAQIRALENQKPMLRAAVTGISAVIDYKGNIIERLEPGSIGIIDSNIQPREGATPYSRLGDWPVLILGFIVFLLGVYLRDLT